MGCCLSHHLFLLVWARCLSQQNSSLPSFFSLQTAKTDTSGGVTGLSRGGAKHSFCTECFPDGLLGSSVGSPLHVPRGTWVLLLAEGRGQALLLRLLCPGWADSPPRRSLRTVLSVNFAPSDGTSSSEVLTGNGYTEPAVT